MKFINTVFRLRYLLLSIALVLVNMFVSSVINENSNWQYLTGCIGVTCFGYMVLYIIITLIVGLTSAVKDK